MAETTEVATKVAPVPSREQLERVEQWTREPFASDPETLRPGTARRRALEAALAEIESGREEPSVEWRQEYSLMLGLERVLAEEEPKLVDGTVLSAHQVDALSGTLTALIAEAERQNGNGAVLELDELDEDEDEDADLDDEDEDDEDADLDDEDDEDLDEEEESDPISWEEPDLASGNGRAGLEEDEQLPEQPEDPGAARRFWFEHATGAGKTVAALGFVEASRTGGTLILTHRRNLVEQFLGELKDRGYSGRISPAISCGSGSRAPFRTCACSPT